MQFGVLGPVEVVDGGEPVRLPAGRARSLLALLLVEAPRAVTLEALIEQLWIAPPPSSAKAVVHNLVSGLRRAIPGELLVSDRGSYRLSLRDHTVDLALFRQEVEQARRALARGESAAAAALLAGALARWRGPALAGAVEPLISSVQPVLESERVAATELRLDAELAIGRYQPVLVGAGALLADHPYRERLYGMRMLALLGLGRRAEALAVFQEAYRCLTDDLGIEPGPQLRRVHQQVLDGGPPLRDHVADRPDSPAARIQLPPPVPRLIGRDELAARMRAALTEDVTAHTVIVLTGLAGVGKSALALYAAHQYGPAFTGGRLYVDLRGSRDQPASPHEVLGRLLRALGTPADDVPADPDERIGRFRGELAGRRVLLLLDDAGNEKQVRVLLPGSPGCAAIVTSRRRLDALGGITMVVPTLAPPDAVRMFREVAGIPAAAASAGSAAAEIVRLCGHLPLAIRIAAARLTARPDWSIADLLERLAGQRGRLDELTIGDLDVRASIALSYRSLPAAQRAALNRLGMLPASDVPAWVPVTLSGRTDDKALDGLVRCHMIEFRGHDQAGQARYRLPDLVHEFARERADEPAPVARAALLTMISRWSDLAHEAARALRPDTAAPPASADPHRPARPAARSLDWFEAERGNLLDAIALAVSLDEPELAGDLLEGVKGFLQARNYLAEREAAVLAVIGCVERVLGPDHRLLGHLRTLFYTYGQHDDVERMSAVATRIVGLSTELGDRPARIEALKLLSHVAFRRGRLAETVELAGRCIAEAGGLAGVERLLAECRWALAAGLAEQGASRAALAEFRKVVASAAISGRVRAIVLGDHAEVLAELGFGARALAALDEADAIVSRIGDEVGAARLRLFRADVAIAERQWPTARLQLEAALHALTIIGDRNGQLFALRRLGDTALGQGDPARAGRVYLRGLEVAGQVTAPVETARLLARLSMSADRQGDTAGAVRAEHRYRRILSALRLDVGCLRLPDHLRPARAAVAAGAYPVHDR